MKKRDEEFMPDALGEARRSLELDEFPVGAVVVIPGAKWSSARIEPVRRSVDFSITRKCLR
jgi:tRNA(Arg) A34 adenosine deaminase TadA